MVENLESKPSVERENNPDLPAVIVLGGGVEKGEVSSTSAIRAMGAAELYRNGVVGKIILSGGYSKNMGYPDVTSGHKAEQKYQGRLAAQAGKPVDFY
ncbi:MAG: hypothetical protein CEN88_115 [Candidatus Berkelbacteria bacterium Licking1014_2]|uniref:Uncharacterized protein n=1 Tax=Candidatus Berkelbacteria bacterium Licking1014_2 TaxID=2017146 RepID=A0A554LWJ2_9BACT|nr:MAG: hypothetical protein CEN88_115 [Candidatus Berkelbacteria bacterium Licking1014_2]